MILAAHNWVTKMSATGVLLCVLSAGGCSSWHPPAALPGLNSWRDEQAVAKKAQNDPFPSPQQVGLK